MSITAIRRACAVLALTAIGIVGTAGGASAAAPATSAVDTTTHAAAVAPLGAVQTVGADSEGQMRVLAEVQFDSVLTTTLYSAALVSRTAFLQTCGVLPPLWRSACSAVANWVFPDLLALGWPNGRCLEVFTRWGYPPVGVRYINC